LCPALDDLRQAHKQAGDDGYQYWTKQYKQKGCE